MRPKSCVSGNPHFRQWLAGFACLLVSCGPSEAVPTLSARLKQDDVALHEPVILELIVQNPTSEPIELDFGRAGLSELSFGVVARDGGTVERIRSHIGPGFHTGGRITVAANQEHQAGFPLGRWFRISSPGRYDVTVEFAGEASRSDSIVLEVDRRFVLPLSVGPYERRKLEAAAEGLVEDACQNRDLRMADFASTALNFIEHEDVVPYFVTMLRCNFLAQARAVDGLARIGNEEAVTVLLVALESSDRELASMARTALGSRRDRWGPRVSPELREKVERALEAR